MSAPILTDDQVTAIRTAGLTDTHWARKLRVNQQTIRAARRGRTYTHVASPPDRAPRDGTGRSQGTYRIQAKPARPRRRWIWE